MQEQINTHMPFLFRDLNNREILLFCQKNENGIWKIRVSIEGSTARRILTGLEDDIVECTPTGWHDEQGFHISFIAGNEKTPYQMYALHGDLDSLLKPIVLVKTKAGYYSNISFAQAFMDRFSFRKRNQIIKDIYIPDSYIYGITYEFEQPHKLIISTGSRILNNKLTVFEYNAETDEQFILECNNEPAYKCSILGDKILYTRQVGDNFEDRVITETNTENLTRIHTDIFEIKTPNFPQISEPLNTPCSNCNNNMNGNEKISNATRKSCLECVEKHLGAAMVLLAEIREGYEYRLLAIGHLHEAEDESQEYTDLHNAIREARKNYQANNISPNWESIGKLVAAYF